MRRKKREYQVPKSCSLSTKVIGSLAQQTLLPWQRGRKSESGESCTMQLYCEAVCLDALHFDQWSCYVVHSLYTKPHYTYGISCRTVLFVARRWSCSVGFLCKHCQTMNIPAVQLADTAFTRLFLPLWVYTNLGQATLNVIP